jgi:hypothetical protein
MDTDRARLLGDADDRILDIGRRDHHQVGQLVDHAQDVRERRLVAARPDRVEVGERARARERHVRVALLHLAHEVL